MLQLLILPVITLLYKLVIVIIITMMMKCTSSLRGPLSSTLITHIPHNHTSWCSSGPCNYKYYRQGTPPIYYLYPMDFDLHPRPTPESSPISQRPRYPGRGKAHKLESPSHGLSDGVTALDRGQPADENCSVQFMFPKPCFPQ